MSTAQKLKDLRDVGRKNNLRITERNGVYTVFRVVDNFKSVKVGTAANLELLRAFLTRVTGRPVQTAHEIIAAEKEFANKHSGTQNAVTEYWWQK